jgi:hypothetical protein
VKIQRSNISSENQFRDFWAAAVSYQKSAQLPLWPSYPEEMIQNEIRAGFHFSAFLPRTFRRIDLGREGTRRRDLSSSDVREPGLQRKQFLCVGPPVGLWIRRRFQEKIYPNGHVGE